MYKKYYTFFLKRRRSIFLSKFLTIQTIDCVQKYYDIEAHKRESDLRQCTSLHHSYMTLGMNCVVLYKIERERLAIGGRVFVTDICI